MPEEENDTPRVLVTPDDLLGFEIDGRYRLDAIIGGGGMGVVYRTTQQNLNRDIAIKLLKLEDAGDRHRIDRFLREIDIIAKMSHPNIVRVFDSGREPTLGLHYIAMELIEGVPLDEVLIGHSLRPELAIEIAYEVVAALTEPHRLGIVHRDIKPANVLVTTRSDDTLGVKVVDFGIARGVSVEDAGKITTTGVVIGSPMYMAPEAARGESIDARTDLYSVGVLMYEMLAGEAPFSGSTPVAIMLRQAVEEPPSLADVIGPDFRVPELVELVDELLSKEPRQRPADASVVLRRLDEIRVEHGMTRVRLSAAEDPLRALAPFLRSNDADADDTVEADPYSPTTPYQGDSEPKSGSDSFHGWLVPESARDAVGNSTLVEAPTGRKQAAREEVGVQSRSGGPGFLVAVLAIFAVIAVAVTGYVITAGDDDATVGVSDEENRLGNDHPVATPRAGANEGAAALAEPVAAAVIDVGNSSDDVGPDVVSDRAQAIDAVEEHQTNGDEASPRPKTSARKPSQAQKRDGEEEDETDEKLKEGIDWIHKK